MFLEYSSLAMNPWNCKKLTEREHYIAHWILFKTYKNQEMSMAFWAMNSFNKITSKVYELARYNFILSMTGENNPMYGKPGTRLGCVLSKYTTSKMSDSQKGKRRTESQKANMRKPKSDKHKANISQTLLGVSHSKERNDAQSLRQMGEDNNFYGKTHSAESNEKNRLSHLGKKSKYKGVPQPKIECPHCLKMLSAAMLKRWHGDNCPSLSFHSS